MYICDVYKFVLRFYCKDTLALRKYILLPKSICHRGFLNYRLTKY